MLLQFLGACVSLVYYEGDYHGKVIDSGTLEPIEGAVVLGVWSLEYETAGGPISEYYDAQETTTDVNGEFIIKGMGPRALTHLDKMDFVIFKAGYDHVDRSTWEELKADKRIQWEGKKAIMSLSILTLEKRKKRLIPYVGGNVPMSKQILFRKEVLREHTEIF
jgi:hypothetical protein